MRLATPINNKDHTQGKIDAPITLLEYGDFECPDCGYAYPILKELQKIEGKKLRFVYRYFPLSEMHPHALRAAYAAEGAEKQGKFWEMHDMLFENQEELEDDALISYAKKLKLDINQFKKDMNSKEVAQKIKNEFVDGIKSGVNGTPTLYINGERFDEPCELDILIKAIDDLK